MRFLLLFVFLFSFQFSLMAQSNVYKPFPSYYGEWTYQWHDDFWEPAYDWEHYYLQGDTLISDVIYKKIFHENWYQGAMREEEKVVYLIPDTSSTEIIWYDFNLELGDTSTTFLGEDYFEDFPPIVDYVDSTLASDGYHKFWFFDSGTMWIEGIGNTNGLMQSITSGSVSGGLMLECMISDSNFAYGGQWYCVVGVEELRPENSSLLLYPNPGNGVFALKDEIISIDRIEVMDAQGKRVLIKEIHDSTTISIEELDPGIYFIQFYTKDNFRYISKYIYTK